MEEFWFITCLLLPLFNFLQIHMLHQQIYLLIFFITEVHSTDRILEILNLGNNKHKSLEANATSSRKAMV